MQWPPEISTPIICAWIIVPISAPPFVRRRLSQLTTRSHHQPSFSLCLYEYSLLILHSNICSSLEQCKEVDLYGNTIVPRFLLKVLFLLVQRTLKNLPSPIFLPNSKKKIDGLERKLFESLDKGLVQSTLANSITHYWTKIEKVVHWVLFEK